MTSLSHFIRTHDLITLNMHDSGHLFGVQSSAYYEKKQQQKKLLAIFAIIAAAALLSPSVAGCPSHFTFKFVE